MPGLQSSKPDLAQAETLPKLDLNQRLVVNSLMAYTNQAIEESHKGTSL